MSTPDYRALIAELLNGLVEQQSPKHPWPGYTQCAMERARALLAAPKAAGVADDDLRGIFYQHSDSGDDGPPWMESEQFIVAARAVLARYGIARPAPVPVGEGRGQTLPPMPVAERLPEKGDTKDGWCWFFRPGFDGVKEWRFNPAPDSADWYRWQGVSHWLPHWALPLPGDQP